MIHIISGPSCAGKSTFREAAASHPAAGWDPHTPMMLPSDFDNHSSGDRLFHYNILRPLHFLPHRRHHALTTRLMSRLGRVAATPEWDRVWPTFSYARDPDWVRLAAAADLPKRAIVLVAPRAVLTARAGKRTAVEPSVGSGARYESEWWLQILTTIDLAGLYQRWCAELSARGIEWRLIDSSTGEYAEIPRDRLGELLA